MKADKLYKIVKNNNLIKLKSSLQYHQVKKIFNDHKNLLLVESCKQENSIEMVKFLVEHGAKINATIGAPLGNACAIGDLDIVKYLIEQGADINGGNGWPIRMASYYGHLNIVKYLVNLGVDIHTHSNYLLKYCTNTEIRKYLKRVNNLEEMENNDD